MGGDKLRAKARATAVTAATFLACLLALIPQAAGVGSITVTPTAQAPGASVSVAGTGFGATKNVSIVFGDEMQVFAEPMVPVLVDPTRWAYNWTRGPIKPGSMHIHLDSLTFPGVTYDYFDDGAGNLLRTDGVFPMLGTMDYALAQFNRTVMGTGTVNEWTASYTYYQYNVTFGRVVTTDSGAFSANFTVPTVVNGNYNVTAIDSGGTFATATLNVSNSIPEVLPLEAILLLSSIAVVASSMHFQRSRKKTG
jgi:hypothetical protein